MPIATSPACSRREDALRDLGERAVAAHVDDDARAAVVDRLAHAARPCAPSGSVAHEPVRHAGLVEQRARVADPIGGLAAVRGRICDQNGRLPRWSQRCDRHRTRNVTGLSVRPITRGCLDHGRHGATRRHAIRLRRARAAASDGAAIRARRGSSRRRMEHDESGTFNLALLRELGELGLHRRHDPRGRRRRRHGRDRALHRPRRARVHRPGLHARLPRARAAVREQLLLGGNAGAARALPAEGADRRARSARWA